MPRSASTWSFNACRLLLAASNPAYAGYEEHLARVYPAIADQTAIVKSHVVDELGDELIRGGKCRAIYTWRAPEDAVASCVNMFRMQLRPGARANSAVNRSVARISRSCECADDPIYASSAIRPVSSPRLRVFSTLPAPNHNRTRYYTSCHSSPRRFDQHASHLMALCSTRTATTRRRCSIRSTSQMVRMDTARRS